MSSDKPPILSSLFSQRAVLLYVGCLLIFGLVGYIYLHQSSPGELAKPHAAVAGSSFIMDCKKCHAPAGLNAGCLGCHTEIAQQLRVQRGYHGYLTREKKTECAKCHSDHNGADFALINKTSWEGQDPKTFTHPQVEFTLVGAHKGLACEKCHNNKLARPFTLPKFPQMHRGQTYLGLKQACTACHADPHEGGKITHCTQCHDQKRWRPAPFFNHDKYYPLRGMHAVISCSKCHMASARSKVSFGPIKGKRCIDCHENPHRTKWAESCEACHKVTDKTWALADSRMTKAEHNETVFRLVAPHQHVKCAQCHTPSLPFRQKYPDPRAPNYGRNLKDCQGCHRDEHRGQFVKRYPRCIACHNVSGWKPSKFDRQKHQETNYPLVGGHLTAACSACHTPSPTLRTRRYVGTPTACEACHKDIHYGQFRQNGVTRCENCHQSPVRWSLLKFDHEKQARFKLGEAHRKVACKECHPLVVLSNGIKLIQYKPIKSQCSDCHGLDIPNEQ